MLGFSNFQRAKSADSEALAESLVESVGVIISRF